LKVLVVQNMTVVAPGLVLEELERDGCELDIRVMDRPGSNLPGSLNGYGALVILGGSMNVYEEDAYPCLKLVGTLIRQALDEGIYILGICLGGQLIARAMGAPVTRNPVEEIGWYELKLTAECARSPLFQGLPEKFPVFHWHSDTFALPAGAALAGVNRGLRQPGLFLLL